MGKKKIWVLAALLLVNALFFWPVWLKGQVPFPGDLLVGQYAPWNASSFLGYAPGGVPHKAQGSDVVRQIFPWRSFSIQMLKNGQLPLWNPYNFSGNPHLANSQAGIFYPLNLIFLLFSFNLAWTIFIILQPLLACLFTYLFLREVKLSRPASLFAGLAFAYGLYLTVWLEWANIGHAILWLPLALFLIEKIIKELKLGWILLFIFALTSSVFAGYIQVTIYLFMVVFAYFFFRLFSLDRKPERLIKIVVILGSGLAAGLLSAIQLLPTWEIFRLSARQAYPPEKIPQLLLPWFGLLTAWVPDFFGNPVSRNYWLSGTYIERVTYIGVLPLLFAFLAIFQRRKTKISLFFIGSALLALLLTLNLPLTRFFYSFKIPIISTGVPTRMLYVFSFSLAVLAGLGMEEFFKNRRKKIAKTSFLLVGFYLFLWLFTFFAPWIFPNHWWISYLEITRRNLILPTGLAFLGMLLLVLAAKFDKQRLILGTIVLLTVFDLFFYFRKMTPFSPSGFVFPATEMMTYLKENAGINRFWGYGSGYIEGNFATQTQTFSTDGYDPLFIRRYGELISASEDGQIKEPLPRADVVLAKGYGPEALRENPFRQRLLNLLGVKYLLSKDNQTFPSEFYQLVWQKGPWQVYENKAVLPRIFLAGRYRVELDKQKMLDLVFDPQFELAKEIILEENLGDDFVLAGQGSGNVTLLDYQPAQLTAKTVSSGNSLLLVTDNYSPGWQAKIDGQPTKIYRADYTFRAVAVPQGEHQIVFSYEPQSFKIGKTISAVTLLLIFGLCLRRKF